MEREASMPGLKWPHLLYPRKVGAMVEVQAKRWTLRQKWHPSVFLSTWPVVTISHDAEDEGIALGRIVAERLGFGYWDRELVMELAGLLNEKVATSFMFDERTREAIEEFLGAIPPSHDGVSADYTDVVRRIFDSVAHRGGAVIVGPGVQFLVAPRDSLRVRLVAPLDPRAWKIPLAHFDLVINTETYAREHALGLVLMAYFAKFGHRPLIAHGLIVGKLSESVQ
jgi:hypothetical protein